MPDSAAVPQELAPDLLPPPFSGGARPGLLDVLAPLAAETRTGRDLVVLVDGLGWGLLKQHRALTPTLRALAGETMKVRTVFPSTTATAMVSLHTGLARGEAPAAALAAAAERTGIRAPFLCHGNGF